jgi:aspartyl-tRNA(Asn)/glutamyl-tRNA(Gln) amidotransferase subunit C
MYLGRSDRLAAVRHRAPNGTTRLAAGELEFPTVPEPLSLDEVRYVARLARLDLTDDDVTRYAGQLSGMLEHFADIDELDLSDVEPMTQPIPLENVLRADIVQPSVDREEVLAAAPAAEDGRFRVPSILGESS